MSKVMLLVAIPLTCLFVAAIAYAVSAEDKPAAKERFFEMRTYIAPPGKLEALNARFRDHTNKLFIKHGMELIGYWTPTEGPAASNTLVYILAYPNKEAREKAWKAFQEDPEWKAAREASEVNGKLVEKVDSVFLKPTDYSPIK
jgi:NIPSNAP protein